MHDQGDPNDYPKINWGPHSDSYSVKDQMEFERLLPSLYSKAGGSTDFAIAEKKEMMERFLKSFGGKPLFHVAPDREKE